jgi:flavin reductase (DIM6/NTAB) family NADH-FMN oxidoreductase RutF
LKIKDEYSRLFLTFITPQIARRIEVKKIKCGSKLMLPVAPIVIIGAKVNSKPTYNVVGNFGVLRNSPPPPMIYISTGKQHYTTQGIKENNTFSVNIPSAELVQVTDYCGTVSGHNVDKSAIFGSFYGNLRSAPMIMECPINFECKVIRHLSDVFSDGDIFFAEIVESYIGEQYLSDSTKSRCKADIKKIDPIFIGSDWKYWVLGNNIARAFSVGKNYK